MASFTIGPEGDQITVDEEQDWGGWGWARGPKRLFNVIGYWLRQAASDQAVVARQSTATILQKVQAAVGQVTVGSTTALSFPAGDVRLPSAWSGAGLTIGQPTAYGAADYVDVDFLDATADTDFGVWTRKARAGSLYHEAASATRGWRKDVPLCGLLLLRTGSLTILDGLDLDASVTDAPAVPRLWAVATIATNNALEGTPTSVTYRQGRVYVTTSTGLYTLNLAGDEALKRDAVGLYRYKGTLADRNAAKGWALVSAAGAIVSADCKHVVARVLPGAMLDAADLRVPTVATATAGGVSAIHPWGAVYDVLSATSIRSVHLFDNGTMALQYGGASGNTLYGPLPYADYASESAWSRYLVGTAASAAIKTPSGAGVNAALAKDAQGFTTGAALLAPDYGNPANGMMAFVTKDSNPGWLPGAVVGAYLCDGATGNITGVTVLDEAFASAAAWTLDAGIAHDAANGELDLAAASGNATLTAGLTGLTVGATYLVEINVNALSAGTVAVQAPNNIAIISTASAGKHLGQFTATGTTSTFRIVAVGATGSVTSVAVKLATADRSYKGKGLQVVGTLLRAPVATGADLAAWSGFSAGNCLEQPYNADLAFGTGDFAFACWMRIAGAGAHMPLFELGHYTGGAYSGSVIRLRHVDSAGVRLQISTDGFATADSTAPSNGATNVWRLIVGLRRGSTLELWEDGVRVATAAIVNAAGSLSNGSGVLRLGAGLDGAGNGALSIVLPRVAASAPTPAQIRRMYEDERALFRAGAWAFLKGGSNNVVDLARDESRGLTGAVTDQGLTVIAGLRPIAFYDSAAVTGWTAGTLRAVAMRNGMTLLAGTAEVAAMHEAIVGKEAVLDHGRPITDLGNRWTTGGVTTDATALKLPLPVFLGERESCTVFAVIKGRQYGATATEEFTYHVRADLYRNAGGVIAMRGSAKLPSADEETTGTASGTWVLDTTNNAAFVQVQGVASTRVVWSAEITVASRISEENRYA